MKEFVKIYMDRSHILMAFNTQTAVSAYIVGDICPFENPKLSPRQT